MPPGIGYGPKVMKKIKRGVSPEVIRRQMVKKSMTKKPGFPMTNSGRSHGNVSHRNGSPGPVFKTQPVGPFPKKPGSQFPDKQPKSSKKMQAKGFDLAKGERKRFVNSKKEGKDLNELGRFLQKTSHSDRKTENKKGLTLNEKFRLSNTQMKGEDKKALREKLQSTSFKQRQRAAARRMENKKKKKFPKGPKGSIPSPPPGGGVA